MAEFGEKLRAAREQQGYEIEYVEEETKIRKLYLTALEEENFAILPPQVYANGFVKRYALFLGLDPEELSREFKQLAYSDAEPETIHHVPTQPERESMLNKLPVKNIALAVIFLLIAIWAGNYLIGYINDLVSRNNTNQPKPKVVEKQTKPTEKNPAVVPPKTNDKVNMTVKIKPDQKAWIQVRVDGEEKLAGILTGGQQQSFTAQDTIYIKVGNAAAVDVTINGKNQEPLGGSGDVVEKEYKNGVKY